MRRPVSVEVVVGDALAADVDVLALKYAQEFYGVDRQVAQRLQAVESVSITPRVGTFRLVRSDGVISARNVLFVGVPDLYEFRYREIREFSRKVLASLAGEAPETRMLALTLHGPGYGLDEGECFLSQVAGLTDAVLSGDYPAQLERVKVVEQNRGRAERLRELLYTYLPDGTIDIYVQTRRSQIGEERSETLRAIGYDSGQKPHIFVAMPISGEIEDLFHYGIQRAIKSSGYLCERIDQTPSTGDILTRIRERIETAAFVVAELTGANPNVYWK